ncbi:helix-turn-helix domain-containing protein [Clostridium polynesiense]|uniref:helix-turn-helix domain-containing protein n=1 Tax=Clostridium polynesiense TaxID=1325933 RepID=UPI00069438CC
MKSLTQKELADLANISRSYLADVEKNRYNPSLETLDKILDALKVSNQQFYSEDKGMSEKDFLDTLDEENQALFKKIKSLSSDDAKKILDIIKIFEEENK